MFKNRVNDLGGGVALFIDSNLSSEERPDLNIAANENFECIFLEVVDTSQRNKIVGTII